MPGVRGKYRSRLIIENWCGTAGMERVGFGEATGAAWQVHELDAEHGHHGSLSTPDWHVPCEDSDCGPNARPPAFSGWEPVGLQLSWTVMLNSPREVVRIAERAAVEGSSPRSHNPRGRFGGRSKRAADIAIASLSLVLLSPLLLIVALAIRVSMGAPVFYGHTRVGTNGRLFSCLKFRTMVNNSAEILTQHLAVNPESKDEWDRSRKLFADPRVTWLGRMLRRSSIDELPQILNVLAGDMSCVGPRPIVAEELACYGVHAREYLAAVPGLTGIWQVSGRNTLSYDERTKLDALYVRRWSMSLDMAILLKTVPCLLRFEETG